MTDTAPPEQVLTEAADKAVVLADQISQLDGGPGEAGVHLAYLAGLIRGGITNLAIAYDRGWDEGYDAAPTPLAAPADLAAVWQGLNDEGRAVVCIVSPELAGMLDAAEDHAELEATESEMGPPPYYVLCLRRALGLLGDTAMTFDGVVEQVEKLRNAYLDQAAVAERYYGALVEALALDAVASTRDDGELLDTAAGVIERARSAAAAWSGNGEPGMSSAAALQDLVHYLDERAA